MQNMESKDAEQWAVGTHKTSIRRGWSAQEEGREATG